MNEYTEDALIATICRMAMEMTTQKELIDNLYEKVEVHRQRAFKFAEEGLRAEAKVIELELKAAEPTYRLSE